MSREVVCNKPEPDIRVPGVAASAIVVAVLLAVLLWPEPGKSLATRVPSKVDPAVVDVTTTVSWQHADQVGTGVVLTSCQVLSGSGVVLGTSGEVLTNNHAVEGATSIQVRDVGNGRDYSASVVGTDRSDDLAVLQLRGASRLQTISGVAKVPRIGEEVFAVGNAGGGDGVPSVTVGRVTALGASVTAGDAIYGITETLRRVIESSAELRPGDSGGPLVDGSGQLIGIDTAGYPASGCGTNSGRGVAIPISRALTMAREVEAGHGSASIHIGATAYLGVEVVSTESASDGLPFGASNWLPPGALITKIEPGSPAETAQLAEGDDIVSVDGRLVGSADQLIGILQTEQPGAVVPLCWVDPLGSQHTSVVRLGSGPPQ